MAKSWTLPILIRSLVVERSPEPSPGAVLAANAPLAAKHVYLLVTAAKQKITTPIRQLLRQLQVSMIVKPWMSAKGELKTH
jgi:hypothetical protein